MTDIIEAPLIETSHNISELAKVLPQAQASMGDVFKNANNPAFRSKYADLAAVVEAVMPALNQHGIALLQPASGLVGDVVKVTTMLLHESGQWVRCTTSVAVTKKDAHGVGSAITYGRRFGLQSMSGVAPTDDDGNAASAPKNAGAPNNLTIQPEGPDWWGAEGPGMSAAQAKREGWGDKFDEWRTTVPTLATAADWKEWCAQNADDIKRLPKGWRIMLREEAEECGRELGAIGSGDRRGA